MEDEATNINKFHGTRICMIHSPPQTPKKSLSTAIQMLQIPYRLLTTLSFRVCPWILLFLQRGQEIAIILFTWNVTSCSADKCSSIGNMIGFRDKASTSIKLLPGAGTATNLNFNILICNFFVYWESSVDEL